MGRSEAAMCVGFPLFSCMRVVPYIFDSVHLQGRVCSCCLPGHVIPFGDLCTSFLCHLSHTSCYVYRPCVPVVYRRMKLLVVGILSIPSLDLLLCHQSF